MRLILQRVASASVSVAGETVASIGTGILALVGVEKGDTARQAETAAEKLANLRIFADAADKMNLTASEVGAGFLIVSQFTLAASLGKGRRPSFEGAAAPAVAEPIVEHLVRCLADKECEVATGRFGARMIVRLVNDGPVTFVLDIAPDSPH